MASPLRVLVVDDSTDDAELLLRELRQAGHVLVDRRLTSLDALRSALEAEAWDVVIAKLALPGFDACAAIALPAALQLDVGFVLVVERLDEPTALAAIAAG